MSGSVRPHGPQPTRLLRPWDFPGKSTGVGCHCLLHTIRQEITNIGKNVDKREHLLYAVGGSAIDLATLENNREIPQTIKI